MNLYLLGLACGIAYLVSVALGNGLLILSICAFALPMIALLSDPRLRKGP